MTTRAAVIVCAYTEQRWSEITAAIASVREQAPSPDEIVLVIDHNVRLHELARRHFLALGVEVVANDRPRGLSGARNTGLAAVSADIVAFLDDDAVAGPGWLATLVGAFDDERVVAVGGRVRSAASSPRPAWWPAEFDWVVGCSWTGLPEEPALVRNVIGCNMAFRRQAVLDVGGFADGIGRVGAVPVGCEETDLCIRLRAADPDRSVLYLPQAEVEHRVSADRFQWAYFRRRCIAEGRSKALVAGRNGAAAALESERAYVRSVIPRAVAGAVRGAVRGERGAAARAAAVTAGVTLTAASYVVARLGGAMP